MPGGIAGFILPAKTKEKRNSVIRKENSYISGKRTKDKAATQSP